MGFERYLKLIRKMNMGRWATEFMHKRKNVSEHSFSVIQIGQMLALLEESFGNTVDWKTLSMKLSNHDVPEAITGDINSEVKNSNKEMKTMIEIIEKESVHQAVLRWMDEEYRSIYEKSLLDGKDDSLEGKILTGADLIDALMECMEEIELGNGKVFQGKYEKILERIKESELESVAFFVKEILPKMD